MRCLLMIFGTKSKDWTPGSESTAKFLISSADTPTHKAAENQVKNISSNFLFLELYSLDKDNSWN